jgi:ferredoxin hydrogenase large subunit
MICDGGCVGGPSAYDPSPASKKIRDAMLAKADEREIHENIANYDMDSFSMHRK